MLTKLISLGKKGKALIRKYRTPPAFLSFSRRIERVKTDEKICAMTFDDGPYGLACSPDHFDGRCLTQVLLDTLEQYDAHGTFDVIGDTSKNYPDKKGADGTPQWGGVRFDHYPQYQTDAMGGAMHRQEEIRRMLAGGHQITNHGYRHIIFGKKNIIYAKRQTMEGVDEVMADLETLDSLLKTQYQYQISMARPPHYVDHIQGGYHAYDLYAAMGYQYMAASFDGAGWLPLDSYEAEVDAMVSPMKAALCADPNALCGQIIFQKDGCNMARRTPVADGLRQQLKLLNAYGYRVITVDQLLQRSAFSDIGRDCPLYEKLSAIAQKKPVAYSDNTVKLGHSMTNEAFALLLSPFAKGVLTHRERTRQAMTFCVQKGYLPQNAKPNAVFSLQMTASARTVFDDLPKKADRYHVIHAMKNSSIFEY